jgi:hypothetical protein
VKLVQLTTRGRDLVAEHFACHTQMLASFTQRLPEDDRVRMAAALRPVLDGDLLLEVPPALDAAPRATATPGATR